MIKDNTKYELESRFSRDLLIVVTTPDCYSHLKCRVIFRLFVAIKSQKAQKNTSDPHFPLFHLQELVHSQNLYVFKMEFYNNIYIYMNVRLQ